MYDFAFYFIYRVFFSQRDDGIFTAKLGVSLMIIVHLIAFANVLSHFGIIGKIPVFSTSYAYNKLAWYPFIGILLAIVFMYLNKTKIKSILEKYSNEDEFYSFKNVIYFSLLVIVPIVLMVKFKQF